MLPELTNTIALLVVDKRLVNIIINELLTFDNRVMFIGPLRFNSPCYSFINNNIILFNFSVNITAIIDTLYNYNSV